MECEPEWWVAMRDSTGVKYLLGDHPSLCSGQVLGSTAVVANTSGVRINEVRYKAWGEDRYSYGTSPTTFRYTGQRQESSLGIYYYGARWYDAALGRFLSPDSIIPAQQGVQGNDRYAYSNNNPLKFIDPTGHSVDCSLGEEDCEDTQSKDEPAIEAENPGYFSLSIGVDTPTIIIISGAVISIVAPEVGLPVIAAGVVLEESLIKPLSFGGVVTIDTFGNIYTGPEISYGKVLTPFIGGSLNFGGIIRDDSQPVITESESQDFFQGLAVSVGTIATGGIIYSPFAEHKVGYYLTGLPEIISANVSYSWMIWDANP